MVERGVWWSKHVLYLCLKVGVEHYVAVGVDGKRVTVGAQLESENKNNNRIKYKYDKSLMKEFQRMLKLNEKYKYK